MESSWRAPCVVAVIVILLLIACCFCLVVLGAAVFVIQDSEVIYEPYRFEPGAPSGTPQVVRPTPQQGPIATPIPGTLEPEIQAGPVYTPVPSDTLRTLEDAIVPTNDLRDLSYRLKGIEDIPLTVEPPGSPPQLGDSKLFWVTNSDNNRNFQVEASLRYITDHLYFWIEEGVRYNQNDLMDLAETFENEIYPTNREFFGSEWTPGVDGDPRLYILFAGGLGNRVAGYFSAADSYHPLAHPYSNAHEMFLINADHYTLRDPYLYGVLAHEFQHMIHWHRDRNETSWLNEGFSELAVFLNGYGNGGFASMYTDDPDIQLNDWPNDPSATRPHYGGSFLFVTYFLDRFGEEATKALVAETENGLSSIDLVLEQLEVVDTLTGEQIGADDVFIDWVIANFLQDNTVGDGRYAYEIFPEAPAARTTERIRSCPLAPGTRDVKQYGVDYIRIACRGDYTLNFEGSTLVRVVPSEPYSGDYYFWSNKGDESNMTLTRSFDFSDHSGPLTFSYWTWYDIEEDYDYVYLLASEDGEIWQILTTPSGTEENPSGNSYGWGYNGTSGQGGEWIQEQVDISRFAGQEIYLRFEYVTDAAVNGEGFLLDDVEIPEIGYFTDFETDDGGWEAEGFVQIQNLLPQKYRLALISIGKNTTVEMISLGDDAAVEIPIGIGGDVEEVVLVVTGTTRFTRETAGYRFSIFE